MGRFDLYEVYSREITKMEYYEGLLIKFSNHLVDKDFELSTKVQPLIVKDDGTLSSFANISDEDWKKVLEYWDDFKSGF